MSLIFILHTHMHVTNSYSTKRKKNYIFILNQHPDMSHAYKTTDFQNPVQTNGGFCLHKLRSLKNTKRSIMIV